MLNQSHACNKQQNQCSTFPSFFYHVFNEYFITHLTTLLLSKMCNHAPFASFCADFNPDEIPFNIFITSSSFSASNSEIHSCYSQQFSTSFAIRFSSQIARSISITSLKLLTSSISFYSPCYICPLCVICSHPIRPLEPLFTW